MLAIICWIFVISLPSFELNAMPKIKITHDRNTQNYARVQVSNETREELLCYVAIDGYKIRFRLQPLNSSKWYKATDTRFNASHFSIWCDYMELYPQYQNKRF
ncbi:hypothetical protein SG34_000480 [Thalassomonas viridans]|uniref:Uncharacterized protein n=1 Tax=Thalassomonas viridans TaxID=137584 RepID=A0AAF0CDG0_9GAMM|nr:hypothetical protein SG34_000480 [Thalassomonas viridans]